MAYPMDSVANYYTPYKEKLAALPELQNYQPNQFFSSKVMMKVILNILKPQAEKIIA